MIDIIKREKIEDIKACINEQNVNKLGQYNMSPLRAAVMRNNAEIVKLILDNGADPNLKDGRAASVLHVAIEKHNTEIVKLLLDKNANPNIPLCDAVMKNNTEIVKLLLEYGADPNIQDTTGHTLLYIALIMNTNIEITKLLLEHKARINDNCYKNKTLLYYAIMGDITLDIIELLLEYDADINVKFEDDYGLLHYIAYTNRIKIAKLLIDKGLNVNDTDKYNRTPLYFAVYRNNAIMVECFINNGANVNINDINKYSPLYVAINKNVNINIVKNLIEHGADLYVINSDERTILHVVKSVEIINLVFNQDEETKYLVNHKDFYGRTPLHYFIINDNADEDTCYIKIINLLLKMNFDERFIDLDIQDNDGRTPLHYIVMKNDNNRYFMIFVSLIIHKADIFIQDAYKETPLDYAHKRNNELIIKYLNRCTKRNLQIHTAT